MEIHTEDLEAFFSSEADEVFLQNVLKNTKRYQALFAEVVDNMMPARNAPLSIEEELENYDDIINQQRLANYQSLETNQAGRDPAAQIPSLLKRKYELILVPGPNAKKHVLPLRGLKATIIGSLITVKAVVVRVSEVKPSVVVASYICDVCGHELLQTVPGKTYMPIVDCPAPVCKTNRTRGKLYPNNATSKFIPYQEIRIQETSDQVPIGNIPRSFTVVARGECTRQCSPGDTVILTGVFLPKPLETSRTFRPKLVHDTYIEAFRLQREKQRYTDAQMTPEIIHEIESVRGTTEMYQKLSSSLAPEIYGMEDVKKALLLLLVGGSTMQMNDGMKIRGDINIALIGDPGVAKSQLLKHISRLTPRGVYTTGKGSSGVGLTAAVIRDPITQELTLEGGALVLADMGVCCIDEFDKMDEADRTAIHEVMEQQTVSIAKAGITTTLNARTSILAAANPLYGRYNKKMSPHENINLPPALLSRFDLIFLLLDKADILADQFMSRHIAYVHQNNRFPAEIQAFDASFIRAYVAQAKRFNPTIAPALHAYIIQKYVDKRKEQNELSRKGHAYTTPRTLLAIIRLAQGMARLRLSEEVDQNDIDEAIRLMNVSRSSVESDMDEEEPTSKYTSLTYPAKLRHRRTLQSRQDLRNLRSHC
jgi:DNA replication licensing factor MCM7